VPPTAESWPRPFDAITLWNTFEQIYDARAALVSPGRLLRPEPILALRFPNGAFYRRWRTRLSGVGGAIAIRLLSHNNLLGFPYRQGFTRSSVDTCSFTADSPSSTP
jgi:hypothetical protein